MRLNGLTELPIHLKRAFASEILLKNTAIRAKPNNELE